MKTLTLFLKKKWFDMIASGEKTEEYREIKPYWEKRLLDYDAIKRDYEMLMFRRFMVGKGVNPLEYPRGFTHVRFHRGYTKITMTFEIDSITFGMQKGLTTKIMDMIEIIVAVATGISVALSALTIGAFVRYCAENSKHFNDKKK